MLVLVQRKAYGKVNYLLFTAARSCRNKDFDAEAVVRLHLINTSSLEVPSSNLKFNKILEIYAAIRARIRLIKLSWQDL
ncbi:unnamed protein product [Rotaria sp. Silwood1]|nr:unnamed protein product [Rotaria sp. Silwood1]